MRRPPSCASICITSYRDDTTANTAEFQVQSATEHCFLNVFDPYYSRTPFCLYLKSTWAFPIVCEILIGNEVYVSIILKKNPFTRGSKHSWVYMLVNNHFVVQNESKKHDYGVREGTKSSTIWCSESSWWSCKSNSQPVLCQESELVWEFALVHQTSQP